MSRRQDIYELAHDWANRTDGNAAGATANLFFAGGRIYSYGDHFMIAQHVWNGQGEHAALFTKRAYSRTTASHIAIVKNAASHLDIIYVPDPSLTETELFGRWYDEIKGIAGSINEAKRPAKYILGIQSVFAEAKRYADFFGYGMPEQLVKAGQIENMEQYREVLQTERDARKAQEKKEHAERLKRQRVRLKLWREFKTGYVDTADGLDYLRYNTETGQVETTQRVSFSLAEGQQLYRFVLAANAKGGCKDCGESFLGRYSIQQVNRSFIRVGCHKVTLKEINAFAKQQGWQ
jgi:hypothetical protein